VRSVISVCINKLQAIGYSDTLCIRKLTLVDFDSISHTLTKTKIRPLEYDAVLIGT